MKATALSAFFYDMASMMEAGVPLRRALSGAGTSTRIPLLIQACERMEKALDQGRSLTEVFEAGGIFPAEAVSVVRAGEKSGEIPQVLLMLSRYFEVRAEMAHRLSAALVYPLLVLGILSGVFLYMGLVIIPRMAMVLPGLSKSHGMCMMLLTGLSFCQHHSWLTLTGAVSMLVLGGAVAFYGRQELFRLLRSVPGVGKLILERELGLGFFTLYLLQRSGSPLDVSLTEAARVTGSASWECCRKLLEKGMCLSDATEQDPYFPTLVSDTLRIGEESGHLTSYLERLHHFYYRGYQRQLERLVAGVRPLLLLVASGFILMIAFGFFQPLYGNLSTMGTVAY